MESPNSSYARTPHIDHLELFISPEVSSTFDHRPLPALAGPARTRPMNRRPSPYAPSSSKARSRLCEASSFDSLASYASDIAADVRLPNSAPVHHPSSVTPAYDDVVQTPRPISRRIYAYDSDASLIAHHVSETPQARPQNRRILAYDSDANIFYPASKVSPQHGDRRGGQGSQSPRGVKVSTGSPQRESTPLFYPSDDDSDSEMGDQIPKPHGEAGRPGRGGYTLRTAVTWSDKRYDRIKVYHLIAFIVILLTCCFRGSSMIWWRKNSTAMLQ